MAVRAVGNFLDRYQRTRSPVLKGVPGDSRRLCTVSSARLDEGAHRRELPPASIIITGTIAASLRISDHRALLLHDKLISADDFELHVAHFHVGQAENIGVFVHDPVQVCDCILVLGREESSNQVVDHSSARCEEDGRNSLCNRVQQLVVVQAEALLVEHAGDLLARVLELLHIRKHCHA